MAKIEITLSKINNEPITMVEKKIILDAFELPTDWSRNNMLYSYYDDYSTREIDEHIQDQDIAPVFDLVKFIGLKYFNKDNKVLITYKLPILKECDNLDDYELINEFHCDYFTKLMNGDMISIYGNAEKTNLKNIGLEKIKVVDCVLTKPSSKSPKTKKDFKKKSPKKTNKVTFHSAISSFNKYYNERTYSSEAKRRSAILRDVCHKGRSVITDSKYLGKNGPSRYDYLGFDDGSKCKIFTDEFAKLKKSSVKKNKKF